MPVFSSLIWKATIGAAVAALLGLFLITPSCNARKARQEAAVAAVNR